MPWLLVETELISWDFHTQAPWAFTEKGQKKRKYAVSGRSLGKKRCLVDARGHRTMVGPLGDERKGTVAQITTCYNPRNARRPSPKAPQVDLWSGWTTAAQDHIGFHLCLLRTENWGCCLYRTEVVTSVYRRFLEHYCHLLFIGTSCLSGLPAEDKGKGLFLLSQSAQINELMGSGATQPPVRLQATTAVPTVSSSLGEQPWGRKAAASPSSSSPPPQCR